VNLVSLDEAKKCMTIIIFGGYKNQGNNQLQSIMDNLRKKGYKKCFLVTQLEDPDGLDKSKMDYDEYITRKSVHWVEKCQVALFVFLKDVPYGSAIIEMTTRLNLNPNLSNCTSFFIDKNLDLQTLERGFIKMKNNYNVDSFDTKKDLLKMTEKSCLHHLLEDKCSDTKIF
jgi:hypothetical protein